MTGYGAVIDKGRPLATLAAMRWKAQRELAGPLEAPRQADLQRQLGLALSVTGNPFDLRGPAVL